MTEIFAIPELLLAILHFADKKALFAVTLVCRGWSKVALDIIWGQSEVTLYGKYTSAPVILNTVPAIRSAEVLSFRHYAIHYFGEKDSPLTRSKTFQEIEGQGTNDGADHEIFLRIVCVNKFCITKRVAELDRISRFHARKTSECRLSLLPIKSLSVF